MQAANIVSLDLKRDFFHLQLSGYHLYGYSVSLKIIIIKQLLSVATYRLLIQLNFWPPDCMVVCDHIKYVKDT